MNTVLTTDSKNEVLMLRELIAAAQQRIDHLVFDAYWGTDSQNYWNDLLSRVRCDSGE